MAGEAADVTISTVNLRPSPKKMRLGQLEKAPQQTIKFWQRPWVYGVMATSSTLAVAGLGFYLSVSLMKDQPPKPPIVPTVETPLAEAPPLSISEPAQVPQPQPVIVQAKPTRVVDVTVYQESSQETPVTRPLTVEIAKIEPAQAEPTEITPSVVENRVPPSNYRPRWQERRVPVTLDPGKPKIAIVIDDCGMALEHTKWALSLPAPLTLAYLTYAPNLSQQLEVAHKAGHELILHVPMQPKGDHDAGPDVLRVDMSDEQIRSQLGQKLGSLPHLVGINNHMGSLFTENEQKMRMVIAAIHHAGLFFLDSRTANQSMGKKLAHEWNVPFLGRDVFLDNQVAAAAIATQLAQVERIAVKRGRAIAIGHPYPETIEQLRAWLPTAKEKFQLVPLSALLSE